MSIPDRRPGVAERAPLARAGALLVVGALLGAALAAAACDNDGPTGPQSESSLLGWWLISRNADVWSLDGGNVAFGEGGAVTVNGNSATDFHQPITMTGAWSVDGEVLTLVLDGTETRWEVSYGIHTARLLGLDPGHPWLELMRPLPD